MSFAKDSCRIGFVIFTLLNPSFPLNPEVLPPICYNTDFTFSNEYYENVYDLKDMYSVTYVKNGDEYISEGDLVLRNTWKKICENPVKAKQKAFCELQKRLIKHEHTMNRLRKRYGTHLERLISNIKNWLDLFN